jgi:hypothetical protein
MGGLAPGSPYSNYPPESSRAQEHGTDRLLPQAERSQGSETRPGTCVLEEITNLRFLSPRRPPHASSLWYLCFIFRRQPVTLLEELCLCHRSQVVSQPALDTLPPEEHLCLLIWYRQVMCVLRYARSSGFGSRGLESVSRQLFCFLLTITSWVHVLAKVHFHWHKYVIPSSRSNFPLRGQSWTPRVLYVHTFHFSHHVHILVHLLVTPSAS